jgi:glycosyltransferase involved in cell wall biosynthesis
MAIALLTNYLAPYRVPLYERLAAQHGVEVICYGGGERYVPRWLAELDQQLEAAPFPARRLKGLGEAAALGRHYQAVIAPFAGGALLPLAYAGARRYRKPFVLWASVWMQPRSLAHALALPVTRGIYRNADAVVAYGEHVRRFVGSVRGRDDDVYVAPQSVEPEVFARDVPRIELQHFRERHSLGGQPLLLYAGRLVPAKGIDVLLEAWDGADGEATLVVIGDGPLAARVGQARRTRLLGPLARSELPAAYATAELVVVPSIPTPRFVEPWGLVCNEAMHQGKPVVATDAVGAVAGGLVEDDVTGLVVPAGDAPALAKAIQRLLADQPLRARLGAAGEQAVAAYSYDAMVAAFARALGVATGSGPRSGAAGAR